MRLMPRSLSSARPLAALLALGLLATPQPALAEAPLDIGPMNLGGQMVLQVSSSTLHSCAVVANGRVYCWGNNGFGQLGDRTTVQRLTAVRVQGLSDVIQVEVGVNFSCALRSNGRVLCWGGNSVGQLGNGTFDDSFAPVRVAGLSGITQISVGNFHGCARRASGRAFCWGRNNYGQLGDGTTTDSPNALRVNGTAVTGAVAVSAGERHSCLLRGGGRVTCWGSNEEGQLGDGTTDPRVGPVVVSGLTSVTSIAAGYRHNCAIRGNKRVFCWGQNNSGQIGIGATSPAVTLPSRVNNLTGVESLGLGGFHGCAIRGNGRIWCWGEGLSGQLGDNANQNRTSPVEVVGPNMVNAVSVSAGTTFTCGVRNNGQAFCWGFNGIGVLGDGTTTNSLVPVLVRD